MSGSVECRVWTAGTSGRLRWRIPEHVTHIGRLPKQSSKKARKLTRLIEMRNRTFVVITAIVGCSCGRNCPSSRAGSWWPLSSRWCL
jgi:hypothetical protein